MGTWAVVSMEAEGKPLPAEAKHVWVIAADSITWKEGDREPVKMPYRLDVGK